MEVFVIQHIRKGEIVAVIESKVSADLTLNHWLASCGFTESAATQFRCIQAPVITWSSLEHIFQPIG
jgi:hypothetical protein